MKHLFIPYELAVMAKDAGFDENTFGWYQTNDKNTELRISTFRTKASYDTGAFINCIAAPLYQQIIDWFDSKDIRIFIETATGDTTNLYAFYITDEYGNLLNEKYSFSKDGSLHFNTRQLATNKAIEQAFTLITK